MHPSATAGVYHVSERPHFSEVKGTLENPRLYSPAWVWRASGSGVASFDGEGDVTHQGWAGSPPGGCLNHSDEME
jgi:hypothetical protein